MLLAIDARNGFLAVGARVGSTWRARFRVAAADRSVDEYFFLISGMLLSQGCDVKSIERAALSCVVPILTERLQRVLERFLKPPAHVLTLGPGVKTGLRIRTDNPAEVGSDLVCDAVAALARASAPLIVVDFGEALTFIGIDAPSDLVGVAIAPGMDAAAAALRDRAAQLPQIRLEPPTRTLGKNTSESVRAGVLIGWSGLIDRLTESMAAELGFPQKKVSLIGTGESDSPPLVPALGFSAYEPYLALDGLARIMERNY